MDDLVESNIEHDLSAVARLLAAHELPSPSQVFLEQLTNQVNREDVVRMMEAQKHMLQRFEKTNEMLCTFNTIADTRYETMHREFQRHTQLLTDMKKDLDSVFKRIRVIKGQLNKKYPAAMKAATGELRRSVLSEEGEEEEEEEQHRDMAPPPQGATQATADQGHSDTGVRSKKSSKNSGAPYVPPPPRATCAQSSARSKVESDIVSSPASARNKDKGDRE